MVVQWEGLKLSPQTEFGLPPHTTTSPATTGSSRYIFVVSFHVPWIFYKCCIAMSKTIFNEIVMALPWEQSKLNPHTEFGIPPHTTALPTTTGSGEYIFVVSFHVLYIIY